MMYQIIYVSTAAEPIDEDGLIELLKQSRANNERYRITGMLLYKAGRFIQAIEGNEEDVTELYEVIKRDLRHRNVDTLRSVYRPNRDFPDWTMGFQNLDSDMFAYHDSFTKILENNFNPEYFDASVTEAHALLLTFKRDSRVYLPI